MTDWWRCAPDFATGPKAAKLLSGGKKTRYVRKKIIVNMPRNVCS